MQMTEAQWLTSDRPNQPVMKWLRRRASERQFYLVSAGVLRLIWDQLDELCRDLVLLIEQYADAECTERELRRRQRAAEESAFRQFLACVPGGSKADSKRQAAAAAVAHAAEPHSGWISACNAVAESVAAGNRPELRRQICVVLRDIFGNPFRPVPVDPSWLSPAVRGIAAAAYAERAFERLPILADALQEAGCNDADLLEHCRGPGPHVRGCWVIDRLLVRE